MATMITNTGLDAFTSDERRSAGHLCKRLTTAEEYRALCGAGSPARHMDYHLVAMYLLEPGGQLLRKCACNVLGLEHEPCPMTSPGNPQWYPAFAWRTWVEGLDGSATGIVRCPKWLIYPPMGYPTHAHPSFRGYNAAALRGQPHRDRVRPLVPLGYEPQPGNPGYTPSSCAWETASPH